MSKYTNYTRNERLEAIARDAAACETALDVIKLKDKLLEDDSLSVEEIVTACLTGAVINKNMLKVYKRRERAATDKTSWYTTTFFK